MGEYSMGRSSCIYCGSFKAGTVLFLDRIRMDLCDWCYKELHYPYIRSLSQVEQEWFDMIEVGLSDGDDVECISPDAWTSQKEIEDSIISSFGYPEYYDAEGYQY
jgi:hypothetical protein